MNKNEELVQSLWNMNHKMRRLHEGKASQSRILIVLQEHETMTQRELTEHLQIQPGSMSEILSKMQQAGVIVRKPNKVDQRTMDILLTEGGKALAAEAIERRRKLYENMFICLTPEEQDTLYQLLEKLQKDWDTRFDVSGDRYHRRKG